ncbi:MAG TPA: hypothetical protein PLM75_00995 [bacterium]|nr:hypothetical protein [bacterium]
MKKRIPIGKSDFKDILESGDYYIDKTLLIKGMIADGPSIIMVLKKLEDKTIEQTLEEAFEQINKKLYTLDLQNQGYSNSIKIAGIYLTARPSI